MQQKIAESEWKIMKIIWAHAPISGNDIIELLADATQWSPKTVRTLLNRLVKKQVIGFEKDGRSYIYSPLLSQSECTREERRSFLNRVYDGALQPMLAAFIEEEQLSDDEIEELRQILNKKGK